MKYIGIGYWKDEKDSLVSKAFISKNLTTARRTLIENEFTAYTVLDEETFNSIKDETSTKIFEAVSAKTRNVSKWMLVTDYIDQCKDIIEEKFAVAE